MIAELKQLQFWVAPEVRQAIAVCCGVGRNSIALLKGMHDRGIRPDVITFADTGIERKETYLYVPILREWLRDVDFPELTVVRNLAPHSPYDSLYGNCMHKLVITHPDMDGISIRIPTIHDKGDCTGHKDALHDQDRRNHNKVAGAKLRKN